MKSTAVRWASRARHSQRGNTRRLASRGIALQHPVTLLTDVTQSGSDAAMPENEPDRPQLSPTAMTVADAAKVLSAVGGNHVTEATLQKDIGLGAPTNADGTLNLVHYAAWLVREAASGN